MVGICCGTPSGDQRDILLGDMIIGEGLVQYDLGRQLPNNIFLRKDTHRDNLPRPGPKIRVSEHLPTPKHAHLGHERCTRPCARKKAARELLFSRFPTRFLGSLRRVIDAIRTCTLHGLGAHEKNNCKELSIATRSDIDL